MSQSGYTPIISYHSTTASAVPSNANLAPGEMALNIADMKLYAENSSGTVTLLAASVTPVANGGTGLTAAGSSGNVLTSNGTSWVSSTPAASGASKGQAIAFSMIFGL